uniref:Guanylate cyclase n=1 Tax=Saccoglossus kowalevskii TaxID=10224 RepID=A0ABM0MCF3_SACKO|nr:PREDICTED: guanylate cyclase 32E-like [Saccoglossus kowalevskii]
MSVQINTLQRDAVYCDVAVFTRCAEYEVSDKEIYPTFARTYPPDSQISKSVVALLKYFDWDHVTLVTSEDTQWMAVSHSLENDLAASNVTIQSVQYYPHPYFPGFNSFPDPFPPIIEETYQETRIYIFLGEYFIRPEFMRVLQKKGLLTNGEYTIITIDTTQYHPGNAAGYLQDPYEIWYTPELMSAYQSLLILIATPPISDTYEHFTITVDDYLSLPPFNYPAMGNRRRNIPIEAAYLYDAVMLFAKAMTEVIQDGDEPQNGTAIIEKIKNRSYESITGTLAFIDNNGDAESNFTVIARQPMNITPGYGMLPVGLFQMINNEVVYVSKAGVTIDWVSGIKPSDEPQCGFHGEYCPVIQDYTPEIVGGTIGGILLVLVIVLAVAYRNWKYEQALASLLWKIDYRDICIKSDNALYRSSSKMSLRSMESLQSTTDAHNQQIFTKIGTFKGNVVAIKHINKKNIDLTRKVRKELKVVRDLRNDHINPFIGACVEYSLICIITEYCARGSLQDILENDEIKLDNMIVASMVSDIIKGMVYIHNSELKSHGNLKSSNCVVDSRWVVKITDFGLHEFKAGADRDLEEAGEFALYRNLLWRAPEFLRMSNPPGEGSQKGDIYSFAIIMYEIFLRAGPYGNSELSPKEIIERVKTPLDPVRPFRPNIMDLLEIDAPDYVVDTIQECWHEIPENRPDLKTIRIKLKPIQKGMKANIFDNMIAIMEKYANNLESIVDDRTQQLIEEKKKTDNLLHSMLPKSVANSLKKGRPVEPESFECVTIFFSDIVGFTALSSASTPYQVIDLLNDLYTVFDSTIKNYDAYKVETIGDAYMLVSGLPIRNGDRHAAEIASSALHLLDEIGHFQIRHRPGEQLKLRIGIHSGPVCSGVVGLTMPRYCLFGDTVNTASRMESNGLPLKIHCSPSCKTILDKIGGYTTVERGLISMKGKGEILTYWLEDQDPNYRMFKSHCDSPNDQRSLDGHMEDERSGMGKRTSWTTGTNSPLPPKPLTSPDISSVQSSTSNTNERLTRIPIGWTDTKESLSVGSTDCELTDKFNRQMKDTPKNVSNRFEIQRSTSTGSSGCTTPLMVDSVEDVTLRTFIKDSVTAVPHEHVSHTPSITSTSETLKPLAENEKSRKRSTQSICTGSTPKRESLTDSGFEANSYENNRESHLFT